MKIQVVNNASERRVATTPSKKSPSDHVLRRNHRHIFPLIMTICCMFYGNGFAVAQQNSSDALCLQEIDKLNNITNYTEIYADETVTCQKSGNGISCSGDFTAVDSQVATVCQQEGGKLYTTTEELSCSVLASDGTTKKVSVSYVNLGICVGNSCATSYLDSVLKSDASQANAILGQSMNNITQSLAASGITDCSISFSSGTRVFTFMTAVLAIGSSFVGMLFVMMTV